jgi:hypothetical protein
LALPIGFPKFSESFAAMCSAELAEWLSLIVFETNRRLADVLCELRSMTPQERKELIELHETFWLTFDLENIEAELAQIVDQHGESVTVDDLEQLERLAA